MLRAQSDATKGDVPTGTMSVAHRFAALGALLVVEYLAVSVLFDVRTLQRHHGPLALLAYLGDAATMVLLAGAGVLLVRGHYLQQRIEHAVRRPPSPRVTWTFLLLHGLAYAAFLALSARVLSEQADSATVATWVGPWLVLGALLLLLLVPVALPPSALPVLIWSSAGTLLLAAALGAMIWSLGVAGERLWPLLRQPTIDSAGWMLARVSSQEVIQTPDMLFGTPGFIVSISPECSGLEGMGLMVAFLGGFMFVNRRELRLSRALWILPVAICASWLANLARLVALVLVGTHWSVDIAVSGFHSKAGWFLFCLLAFGFIVAMRSSASLWRTTEADARASLTEESTPYLMPLLALLATALVTGLFSTAFDRLYGVRAVVVCGVLWHYRRRYEVLLVRPTWEAFAIGIAVFVLWIALVPRHDVDATNTIVNGLAGLGPLGAGAWIVVRVLGSVLLVPIAEELAFRGYLLRRMVRADFAAVPYHAFHLLPLVGSSLAFGLLHSEPLAGTLAGIAYALSVQRRGRLSDAIVAHGVTNALITVDVLWNGAWALW